MKKFYTLLAATVLAISAMAVSLNLESGKQVRALDPVKKELQKNGLTFKGVKAQKEKSLNGTKRVLGATKKAPAISGLEGTWTFSLGDYYFQGSVGLINVDFDATVSGNKVTFKDPTGNVLPFEGTYNASTGKLTFSRQYHASYQFTTGIGYVYQEPFVYNWDTDDLDVQDIVATVTDNLITFEEDNGISWVVYSDRSGSNFDGYYDIYDLLGATKAAAPEDVDEVQEGKWKTIGNATFVDAWIMPSYTSGGVQIDPNKNTYKVELQQNVENKNLYRLWEPYKASILKEVNASKFKGQIQFEVSDPNYVEVVACGLPSGFKNSNGEFYFSNELGWYLKNYSALGKQTIIDILYEGESADTFKDGVVTIASPMFDFTSAYSDGYSWNNNPYSAQIIFPTVSLGDITWNAYPNNSVNFVVPVEAEDFAEDAEITVYYKGPNDNDFVAVNAMHERYDFTLENLEPDTDYTVTVYAACGDIKSEEKVVEFHTLAAPVANPSASIMYVAADEVTATTANVYGVYGFQDMPEDSKLAVIVTESLNRTDTKVYIDQPTYGGEFVVALTGLTPATTYLYYAVAQIESASGDIIARSELKYGEFTTLEGGSSEGGKGGNMTTQVDMNMGWTDEPDLAEAESYQVTATFDNATNELKFESFGPCDEPITFVVDPATGDAVATDQVAYVDDYYESPSDYVYYYYSDFAKRDKKTYAKVVVADGKTTITVDPWGEYSDKYDFFNSVFYNTVITLDFDIYADGDETDKPEVKSVILYNPNKAKKNILEGEDLGAPEGWSMQCMNTSKNLESSDRMTVNGEEYISIKLSNGAQNTITLPEGCLAQSVTFYAVINNSEPTDRPTYWKEVNGVTYDAPATDDIDSYKDFKNPVARTFELGGVNSFTFTNGGEQFLIVAEVKYTEAPAKEGVDAPVFNPENGATVAPYDYIEITAAEGADIYWRIVESGDGGDDDSFGGFGDDDNFGVDSDDENDGIATLADDDDDSFGGFGDDEGFGAYTPKDGFSLYVADECMVPYNWAEETITFEAYAVVDGVESEISFVTYNVGRPSPGLMWIDADGLEVTEWTVDLADAEPAFPLLDGIMMTAPVFTSSDEAVATINEEGGITLVAAGETTITASLAETAQYQGAEVSFKLIVTDNSGIVGIKTDNGDVRYFNIQGIEVKNPAAGNIYIKVTGNKIEKVRVK